MLGRPDLWLSLGADVSALTNLPCVYLICGGGFLLCTCQNGSHRRTKTSPQLCFHVFFLVRNLNLGDSDTTLFLCPADRDSSQDEDSVRFPRIRKLLWPSFPPPSAFFNSWSFQRFIQRFNSAGFITFAAFMDLPPTPALVLLKDSKTWAGRRTSSWSSLFKLQSHCSTPVRRRRALSSSHTNTEMNLGVFITSAPDNVQLSPAVPLCAHTQP